jgi:hypothetical protein
MMTSSNGSKSRFKSDLLYVMSINYLECIDPGMDSVSAMFLPGDVRVSTVCRSPPDFARKLVLCTDGIVD